MSATYQKLKSGEWGVRSTTPLEEGQSVTVRKKNGESKEEVVSRIVWQGEGVWLAAIRPSRRTSGEVCAECGRGGHLVSDLEDGLMKHWRCCDIPPG